MILDAVDSVGDEAWRLSAERRAHVKKTLGIGNGDGGNGRSQGPNGNGDAKEARIRKASRKVLWAAAACLQRFPWPMRLSCRPFTFR